MSWPLFFKCMTVLICLSGFLKLLADLKEVHVVTHNVKVEYVTKWVVQNDLVIENDLLPSIDDKRRTVCVFTRTPRQDSLFKTNLLNIYGSGRFIYKVLYSTDCQFNGNCNGMETRFHPECNATEMPTVILPERYRFHQLTRFGNSLHNGLSYIDLVVATGDEYCNATEMTSRAHFRTYYGREVITSSLNSPMYLPLGPREEFERVVPNEMKPMHSRTVLVNFIGSVTSSSRLMVQKLLKKFKKESKRKVFLHVIPTWAKQITKKAGYLAPKKYKSVLLDSKFTVCPFGHNPESFRIFEAAEAGSIPIMVLHDEEYRNHSCTDSLRPLIDSKAPFVFLNSWEDLPAFLDRMANTDLNQLYMMQQEVLDWYADFMKRVATRFETALELRFRDRLQHGHYKTTSNLPSLKLIMGRIEDPTW